MTTLPTSEFKRLHQSSPDSILGRALASIDGYAETRRRLADLPAPFRVPENPDPRPGVDEVLDTALRDGAWLDSAEVRLAAAGAYAEAQGQILIADAVERARSRIGEELDELVRPAANSILQHLNGMLQASLASARELRSKLNNVRDFEAAVDRGLADEFRGFRERQAEYAQLRKAQYTVVKALTSELISNAPVAHARDFAAADPEHVLAVIGVSVLNGTVIRQARTALPAEWASPGGFAWCLDRPAAGAWIPDLDQLRSAQERLAQQIADARAWLGPKHTSRDQRRPFPEDRLSELRLHLTSAHATANV